MKTMKNLKLVLMLLIFAAVFITCSKKDDAATKGDPADTTKNKIGNEILKPGTMTITMNGDGYTNKTLTYTGQAGNSMCLWAARYVKDSVNGFGPDRNYTYASLYLNPPKYDSSETTNGAVYIRFTGNTTMSNDPWIYTDLMNFRGILDFTFKLNPADESNVMYMIEEGVTVGSTTVTEYGTRVKGTFTATKMKKFDLMSTTDIFVDITGSFDLEATQ
jgi:hypothetical protein